MTASGENRMIRVATVSPPGQALEKCAASEWSFSLDGLPSRQPLKDLLIYRGLLTKKLKQVFGGVVSIKLLQMSEAQQGNQLRQVIIKCDVEPMIYAETLISSNTISRHPWLLDLGDQPLGARMCEYGKVTRSEYEYSCLATSDLVFERAVVHAHLDIDSFVDMWARRYRLSLGSCDLQITEVFLPAVLNPGKY
jgi:chorismate-pyruvate lyase